MTFPFKSISKKTEQHPVTTTTDDGYSNKLNESAKIESASMTDGAAVVKATASVQAETALAHQEKKKRFRIIDETKLSPEEAERLLIKRAYNRECADRARKRTKVQVQALQQQIEALYADKAELRQQLAHNKQKIQRLQEVNQSLLLDMNTGHFNVGNDNGVGLSLHSLLQNHHPPQRSELFLSQNYGIKYSNW